MIAKKKSLQTLPAKISQPRIHKCFKWQRLIDSVESHRDKPLVWISGPAGCGKTMLCVDYLTTHDFNHLWYHVDSRDTDPATLFYYLELWLKSQVSDQIKSLPLFCPERFKEPSIFCKNYFEVFFSLCPPKPVLVFDNCQKLQDDAQFFQIIQFMATQLPSEGQIFLISRSDPPANFARMVLHQDMGLLQREDFQLTAEEILNFSLEFQHNPITQVQAEKIYKRTMGWAAGVVVLLTTPEVISKLDDSEVPPLPEALFDYFAGEIFAQFDEETKNFLLKTAWLPKISAAMAHEVTGHENADQILNRLSRKNYFTIRHYQGRQSLYQYHPIFKEFLKKQARAQLSREALVAVKSHAATLLIQEKRYAEAAKLFRLCEQWDKLGELICKKAEDLIGQGRFKTLYNGISSLPEKMLQEKPCLKYWLGASRLPFDPLESQDHFEEALVAFGRQENIDGCFCALSGILSAIHYQQTDFKKLDQWFSAVQQLREAYPEERAIEIEAQLAIGLLTNFSCRAIQNPHFDSWIKRAESIWIRVPNIYTRLKLASVILDYSSRAGKIIQSKQLIDALNEMMRTTDPASNASLVAHMQIAMHYWFQGENAMAKQHCRKVVEKTRDSGIRYWDCMIWALEAASSLGMGKLDEADSFLEKMGLQLAGREPNLCTVLYFCLLGWRAARNDESDIAIESFTKATKVAEAVGVISPWVLCHHGMAHALFDKGNIEEARKNLRMAGNNIAAKKLPSYQYQLLLSEAYFELKGGNEIEGLNALNMAMAMGRKHGFSQISWWGPDVMEYLCAQALSKEVEATWVKKLIHRTHLKPDGTSMEKEQWPWAFRIFTLGKFSLEKDGSPIGYSTKAPKKQLDLLKVVIALGGKGVSKMAVIDALWPDVEGSKATRAFGITLHRVRKLLGNDHAIQLQEGKLTLDSSYCWVDCWDFERLVSQAEKVSICGDASQAVIILEKAVEMYGGSFLSQNDSLPGTIAERKRLKNLFLQAIERLCNNLESAGNYEEAASWYNRGLKVEDFPEELYQRLILCLKKLERKTEAISIYRRCKRNLEKSFGRAPSAATESIYKSLLDNK